MYVSSMYVSTVGTSMCFVYRRIRRYILYIPLGYSNSAALVGKVLIILGGTDAKFQETSLLEYLSKHCIIKHRELYLPLPATTFCRLFSLSLQIPEFIVLSHNCYSYLVCQLEMQKLW